MAPRRRGRAEANEAAVTGASQTHLEALKLLEELRSRQCLTSFLDSWLDPFPSEKGISRLEYVEEWCDRRTADVRDVQLARDRAHRAEERVAVRRRREQEAERRREREEERRQQQEEAGAEAERLRLQRAEEEEERRRQQEEAETEVEAEAEAERLRVQGAKEEEERRRVQGAKEEEERRQRQQAAEADAERLRVQGAWEEEERRQRQEEAAEAERLHEQQAKRLQEQDEAAKERERDTEILGQQEEPRPSGPAPQQVDDIGESRSGSSSQEANEEGNSGGSSSLVEDSIGDNTSAANDGGKNSSSDNDGANTSQRGGGPNSEPRRTDGDGVSNLLHAAGLPESNNHQKEVSQRLHPPRTPNPLPDHIVGLGLATPSPTPIPSSNKTQRPPGLLRLTSVSSGQDVMQRTTGPLKSALDGYKLSPHKAKRVYEWSESLFSVKAWWELHCCMTSYVEASGFYEAETQEESDRRDSLVSLASSDHSSCVDRRSSPGPGQYYLKDFVQQWKSLRDFSNNTLKPGLTTMKMMRYEENLYVYWRRLLQVWTSYHGSCVDNSMGDVKDDEPGFELDHSPDEADHLMTMLHEQLEARKEELDLRQPPAETAHTSLLLKRLVAPLLGFRVADKNFDKLFSYTLSSGKMVYCLTRHLGPGAIAIVRKRDLRIIGAKLLTQSLPQLTREHPSLRTCLDTVNEIFLTPLSEGKQLDYGRVGTFLRIRTKDELFNSCEGHKDGLSGLFSSEGSPTERNIEPESGSLGVGTTSALTCDVEETGKNGEAEDDEDEEPIFDIRELLAEEGRRDRTSQSSGTRDANRTRGASGQGDRPITPPTTGQKRSRDADRTTPESPSKRRGRGSQS